MGNPNRNRARTGKEQPALQLTSYQLVMAICALLLLMCVLFIAGILVQRFTSESPADAVAANELPERASEPAPTTPLPRQGEGRQLSPRPVVLPPGGETSSSSASSSATAEKRSESNAKYIPAPPPRRTRNDEVVSKPDITPEKAETAPATQATAPESQPAVAPTTPTKPEAPSEPSAPSVAGTPPTPAEVPEELPKPEATPAATEPQATAGGTAEGQSTSAAAAGPFTIQVASFDSNNLERAKRFKSETEDATDFTVNLVPAADGAYVRAYIGEYKERGAADAARDEMRKMKGFEDCFVKSLAEE